jgi:hypothetical protein
MTKSENTEVKCSVFSLTEIPRKGVSYKKVKVVLKIRCFISESRLDLFKFWKKITEASKKAKTTDNVL